MGFQAISAQERLLFTKHLATMLHAGVPLLTALDVLQDQTAISPLKSALKSIAKDVENGLSFSGALKKHPRAFDNFYRGLVEVSEQSGTLDKNLGFLAQQLEKTYQLQQKIQSAMLYPTLVFFATLGMGSFVGLYILPQLVPFFESFEFALPLSTRILLLVANFFRDFGTVFLVFCFFSLLGLWLLLKHPVLRYGWQWCGLRLPLVGPFLMASEVSRLTRTLGVLLQSGVPLLQSLEIAEHTLQHRVYLARLQLLQKDIKTGKSIAKTLSLLPRSEFPVVVTKMVAVGETTGKLDEMFLYLSDFYENEIDTFSKNLSTLIEPVLLLTIGLVVGFVAFAVISPIYELTSVLRRG